jgi:hypothetical protein
MAATLFSEPADERLPMCDLAINEIHSMASLGGESNLFAIRSSHRLKASSKRRNGPSLPFVGDRDLSAKRARPYGTNEGVS